MGTATMFTSQQKRSRLTSTPRVVPQIPLVTQDNVLSPDINWLNSIVVDPEIFSVYSLPSLSSTLQDHACGSGLFPAEMRQIAAIERWHVVRGVCEWNWRRESTRVALE